MLTSTEAKIIKSFEWSQDALVLQSSDLSLETIAQMVHNSAIDLEPRYQRRDRWTDEDRSELIESFLLNVPVPPVYLAEDDFGTYSVIDGKQRITAIYKFMRNQLTLQKLNRFTDLNGLTFDGLPKPLRNALSIRPYIRVVTLLKQTNPDLKYEVFTRLNTGGQPLLPQEIRNALYRGPLNDLLFQLAKDEAFLRKQLKIITEKESAFTQMTDVEMVLRFLSLRTHWKDFSGDSRRSMDEFMAKNKKPNPAALKALKSSFSTALSRCEKLWGDHAFRRYAANGYRDQFLAAMYDAEMIAVDGLSDKRFQAILSHKNKVISETKNLFKDQQFEESVRVSTNTPARLRYRIKMVIEMLQGIKE